MIPLDANACKVCERETVRVGEKCGRLRARIYTIRSCTWCGYSFVADPDTDFDALYDEKYYRGEGADPLVDYMSELEHPEVTIRSYEWRGITKVVSALKPLDTGVKWLDYGCGNGGLVRWVNERTPVRCVGYEEGWIAREARTHNIAIVNLEEAESGGPYDIITAIEVLEHLLDPRAVVQRVAKLLAPDGVFFYTTGNASRYRGRLTSWGYVVPEVHVSFYEPRTLRFLLEQVGLVCDSAPSSSGFSDIIRYKILKNLGVRNQSPLFGAMPWRCLTSLVDTLYGVSDFPIARKLA